MLSNPKWILFYFLFFGTIVVMGQMLDGAYAPPSASAGVLESIAGAISYDYAWIPGDLQIVRWALVSVQAIGGMLIGYEMFSGFFGRK